MHLHRATFVGTTPFPLDMLRYDTCFPWDSQDASRIATSVRGTRDTLPDGTPPPIVVATYKPNASWEWTKGRWATFGWTLIRSNVEKRR